MKLNEKCSTSTNWSIPRPLRDNKSTLPCFPVNCLPIIPKAMAIGISQSTSTDISMSVTALLAALSHCFSGVYRMEGKPDHSEPITLYSLILAEPAERKSPIMRFVKAPFISFAKEYNDSHKAQVYASQEEKIILQAEIEKLQKIGEASPEEIAQKRSDLDEIQSVNFLRVCVDDVTPEALVKLLSENETLLMLSDEAGVFKNFGGRYSSGVPNLDLMLKCWGGESFQKDRCGSEPVFLPRPYLSVCLCGQPYILEDMMENRAFLSSGMIARFLYCFPKSFVGKRKYETAPLDNRVIESYKNLVFSALDFKYSRKNQPEIYLHFTLDARKAFADYYDTTIEPVLLTDFAECPDWGGKYHGLILRLCGLLHCIKCLSENVQPETKEVDIMTLGQTIDIADFYKSQARYAYGIIGIDTVTADAEYILKKLRANNILEISCRDLQRLCRKFKGVNEMELSLDLLKENGFIREKEQDYSGSGRKPSTVYEVNPML